MKKLFLLFLVLKIIIICNLCNLLYAEDKRFNQKDRERLIRLEATLKVFMVQIDKRFEQIDKRFEQIDKRFEQIDKRFELVDKRIEELREDMNKRFDQMMNFLWMLTAIFTTLTGVVIGFAYWDRRTIIKKAKEETIEEIEREGKLRDLIKVLRELAVNDKKLAETLKNFGLL